MSATKPLPIWKVKLNDNDVMEVELKDIVSTIMVEFEVVGWMC